MTDLGKLLNTDWRGSALCAQVGGDLWFPDKGENAVDAKRVCARCPVRRECLDEALTRCSWDDQYGVRGGLSPRERDRIRTETRSAA